MRKHPTTHGKKLVVHKLTDRLRLRKHRTMKYALHPTKTYRKDLRRIERRSKDSTKLDRVIKLIQQGVPLLPQHRNHSLSIGKYKNTFELHVEGDFLLIYKIANNCIRLIRTGTHADIF